MSHMLHNKYALMNIAGIVSSLMKLTLYSGEGRIKHVHKFLITNCSMTETRE